MAALTALVAVVSSCSSGGSKKSGDGLTRINVGFNPTAIYFSTAVAKDQGFFEQQGLDVKFVTPQDGPTLFRLVLGGRDINLTVTDSGAPISYKAQGQNVSLLGSVLNKSPWQIYAADKPWANGSGSFTQKVQALKGKTIGVPGLGAAGDLVLRATLKQAGIDPQKDVKIVSLVGLPAVVSQFQRGTIDAYVFQVPFGELLSAQKAAHTYVSLSTDAPPELSDVAAGSILASSSWLSGHTAVAQKYVAAEAQAVKWILDPANNAAAVRIFNSSFLSGKNPAIAQQEVSFVRANWYPSAAANLVVPQSAYSHSDSLLTTSGQIKAPVPYDSIVAPFAREK